MSEPVERRNAERRSAPTYCDNHSDALAVIGKVTGQLEMVIASQRTIFEKLDSIQERASQNHDLAEDLRRIVTNGLSSRVEEIASTVKSFHTDIDSRVGTLEDFQWFRDLATKWRDHTLVLSVKLVVGVILLMMFVHITDRAVINFVTHIMR